MIQSGNMATVQSLQDEVQRLNLILLGVGERFDNVETKIVALETSMTDQTQSITTQVAALKDELDPTIKKLNGEVRPIIAAFGELQKAAQMAAISAQTLVDVQTQMGSNKAITAAMERRTLQTEQATRDVATTLQEHKAAMKAEGISVQGQLHGALSAVGTQGLGGGSGGGGPKMENLATHRLMMSIKDISGEETYEALDDWYADITGNVELLMPGSKTVLNWAEKRLDATIGQEELASQGDASFIAKLGRELFVLLRTKTAAGSKARAQLKLLEIHQGLEGWRLIRNNIAKRDTQRLQREFSALSKLAPMKMDNFHHFATALTSWEGQLARYEAMNLGFQLLKEQRRNILMDALPDEVRKQVDLQGALRPFETYDDLTKFLRNLSTTSSFRVNPTHDFKPFSMNLVGTETAPATSATAQSDDKGAELNAYTDAELETWVTTQDFTDWQTNGGQVDDRLTQVLMAVAKGKGKGKNGYQKPPNPLWKKGNPKGGKNDQKGNPKGGGTGKGGFKGNCHVCGEYGHSKYYCPQNKNTMAAALEQNPHGGRWALCLSDMPPSDKILTETGWKTAPKINLCAAYLGQPQGKGCYRPEAAIPAKAQIIDQAPRQMTIPALKPGVPMYKLNSKPTALNSGPTYFEYIGDEVDDDNDGDSPPMPEFDIIEDEDNDENDTEWKPVISRKIQKQRIKMSRIKKISQRARKARARDEATRDDAAKRQTSAEEFIKSRENLVSISGTDISQEETPANIKRGSFYNPETQSLSGFLEQRAKLMSANVSSISLFTTDEQRAVMPVTSDAKVWIQVPVAVDSGSCRHVTPNGVFSLAPKPSAGSAAKQKFYGADGSPIDDLGCVDVEGASGADSMSLNLAVCNITRPLASVYEILEKGNDVVFSKKRGCYIQCASTGRKIPLRQDGKLFFLDLWVLVPADVARENPFVRQSAPQ